MTEKTDFCVSDTTTFMGSKYQNERKKRTNKVTLDAWGLPAGCARIPNGFLRLSILPIGQVCRYSPAQVRAPLGRLKKIM